MVKLDADIWIRGSSIFFKRKNKRRSNSVFLVKKWWAGSFLKGDPPFCCFGSGSRASPFSNQTNRYRDRGKRADVIRRR